MKHNLFSDEVRLFEDTLFCSYDGGASIAAWVSANAGTIAQVTAAAATVASTVSQTQQATASAQQDKNQAAEIIHAARYDEELERMRGRQVVAKQKAKFAAAGFDPDSGTPLELMMDSAFNSELEALNVKRQAAFDANFLKTRARRTKAQIPGLIFQGVAGSAGQALPALGKKP